ncbi:MAG TPA: trypsin-like peptidase domain-containing protein [Gemmatimonadaceae bacterium]|nr:trypsin-like peptidase domain-containing protein [Gemmatimonadaceae bacterium]
MIARRWRMPGALAVLSLSLLTCRGDTDADAGLLARADAAQAASLPAVRRTVITDAVARVAPSVVSVQTQTVARGSTDPFDQFFGVRPEARLMPGIGSGFITRADGIIVTNAHVVAGAQTVSVAMRDGTSFPARVIGADQINDLAVLKIEAGNLPVAPLGRSDDLVIGEWAIAIGNPYGFLLGNPEPTVTTGVISATGRNLVARSEGGGVYVDMIQTDAAINPGNSGGPLINAAGEVVGVNSSIYSPSGGSVGLGFAIPINRVRRVTEDLLAHGSVRQPWVGIKLAIPDNADPRNALSSGVVVRSVVPGSPAAQAGVQRGDVIVRSRNRALRNPFDWEAELLDLRVGEEVPITIRRGDREIQARVRVADLPEVSAPRVAVLRELELVTVTPSIRAERSLRSTRGALIVNVSDRVASEIGIERGDVIVQINRTPVESAEDAARALDLYGGRGAIRLFFERGGNIYSTDFIIR